MISFSTLLATLAVAEAGQLEPGYLYPDGFDFSTIDPWLPNM